MVFRVPEYERAVAGYQITEMPDPPLYFQIRATGRIHHVRSVQRIERHGEVWFSLWFWCNNIAQQTSGRYLDHLAKKALVCTRCDASPHQTGRGRREKQL